MQMFDKWAVLDAIGYNPHPGQLIVAESNARHKVASCGRRFGKSNLGGYELLVEALYTKLVAEQWIRQMKRREFWIVGPEYCVDEETEILTIDGWRRQSELEGDESVLTLNMETGMSEWQNMEYMSVFHTLPGLHRHVYESTFRGHNSVTTGEHRWPIRSGRRNLLRWAKTEDIGSSRDRIMTTAPHAQLPTEAKYEDALVELMAWYWTEGTWARNGRTVEISQNYGPHWHRITAACNRLFGDQVPHMRNGSKKYDGVAWSSRDNEKGQCLVHLSDEASSVILQHITNLREKTISMDFIRSLTQSQLELFIKVSVWADSDSDWESDKDIEIGQKFGSGLDVLEYSCILSGRRTRRFVRNGVHGLGIYSTNKTGEIHTNSMKRTQVKRNHEGIVWCPKTPNGTWMMRRNGCVSWTGNSDAEKEFRVLWNELNRLEVPFDHPGTYNDPIGGNMHISLWNGAFQVHAKSAKYPSTLVGEALSGVIMAEAAKMKSLVWTKYVRPTLADFGGWSLHTSTPEGKNHFYDLWRLGRDPGNPDWASWRMPSWVNPYVYKTPTKLADVRNLQSLMATENLYEILKERVLAAEESGSNEEAVGVLRAVCDRYDFSIDNEILDLMASMSVQSFNQEIGADFTDFVGRVFKDFDEEIHVGDLGYNSNWPTFAAVDYGYRNPNVWLVIQVGPWGEINVIRELYVREYTAQEFADEIKYRGLDRGVLAIYPDPASPGDSEILSDTLGIPWRGGTGGELNHRLDAIRRALKERNLHVPRGHIDRRPTIMWDRSCTMSIYEMNEYRYPEEKELNSTPGQEMPLKKDDHSPEALGRFFAGHFETPQESAGPARVSRARVRN